MLEDRRLPRAALRGHKVVEAVDKGVEHALDADHWSLEDGDPQLLPLDGNPLREPEAQGRAWLPLASAGHLPDVHLVREGARLDRVAAEPALLCPVAHRLLVAEPPASAPRHIEPLVWTCLVLVRRRALLLPLQRDVPVRAIEVPELATPELQRRRLLSRPTGLAPLRGGCRPLGRPLHRGKPLGSRLELCQGLGRLLLHRLHAGRSPAVGSPLLPGTATRSHALLVAPGLHQRLDVAQARLDGLPVHRLAVVLPGAPHLPQDRALHGAREDRHHGAGTEPAPRVLCARRAPLALGIVSAKGAGLHARLAASRAMGPRAKRRHCPRQSAGSRAKSEALGRGAAAAAGGP
mmetsp:Transcript_109533/g.342724  ORF Transcript_109533/g.342724 Transcript_109533/m.342724 type:complete len:349 (+) Transcript_109533:1264-2310(+)